MALISLACLGPVRERIFAFSYIGWIRSIPRLQYNLQQFLVFCWVPLFFFSSQSKKLISHTSWVLSFELRREGEEWVKEEETGSAADAGTGTTLLDVSVTDVSSLVFLLTPKLQLTPSGFRVLVIGSVLVSLYLSQKPLLFQWFFIMLTPLLGCVDYLTYMGFALYSFSSSVVIQLLNLWIDILDGVLFGNIFVVGFIWVLSFDNKLEF